MSSNFSSPLVGVNVTATGSETGGVPNAAPAQESGTPALGSDSIQSAPTAQVEIVALMQNLANMFSQPANAQPTNTQPSSSSQPGVTVTVSVGAPSASAASPAPSATPSAAPAAQPSTGSEQLYSSATASSNGDPHETFSGSGSTNGKVDDRWNSMTSHADLTDSDSISGGYTVSNTVGTPNAKGITTNSSASVTTNNGQTVVTMNKNGSYSVTNNGQTVTLQKGQTKQLGNGETVTLNKNGSLTVSDSDAQGGTINTTLKSWGGGVNVSTKANNVDLGGYLVTQQDGTPPAQPGAAQPASSGSPTSQPATTGSATSQPATAQSSTSTQAAEDQAVQQTAAAQSAAATGSDTSLVSSDPAGATSGDSPSDDGAAPISGGAPISQPVTASSSPPATPTAKKSHLSSDHNRSAKAHDRDKGTHTSTVEHHTHRDHKVATAAPPPVAPSTVAGGQPAPPASPVASVPPGTVVSVSVKLGNSDPVNVTVDEDPSAQGIASSGGADTEMG